MSRSSGENHVFCGDTTLGTKRLIGTCRCGSLRLDVGGPDDLAPLLGFIGDELAEVGRRDRKHGAAQFDEPRLDLGIGEARVDLPIEFLDDLGGRAPRRAETEPCARLVARQEFSNRRDVRQSSERAAVVTARHAACRR